MTQQAESTGRTHTAHLRTLAQVVSAVLIVVGVVGSGWRATAFHHPPGDYQAQRLGFGDFHNGIYFPAKAFAAGVSPYGVEYTAEYPVPRPTPLYSPLLFLLHTPLAALPIGVAEWAYFAAMLGMIAVLAGLLVKDAGGRLRSWFLPVVAIIVISRAGAATLFSGYFTFELVLGTVVALACSRSRPWLAGIGMALASLKPTFIIPLTLLMLARGDWRAVWRGVLLSSVGAAMALAWLLRGSTLAEMTAGMKAAQSTHRLDPTELPINSWTRIDLPAIIGKWTAWNPTESEQLLLMLVVLLVPACLLWRNRNSSREPCLTDASGSLIAVALLVSLYHQSYDALLALVPIVGIVVGAHAWWAKSPVGWRITICLASLVPLFNITSTGQFLSRAGLEGTMFQLVTSFNCVALVLAMVGLCVMVARKSGSTQAE